MQGRLIVENMELDLSEEFSNSISYAIDDIRNIDSKSTPAFTKTGILPGTARNNAALGNIFDFNSANFTVDGDRNIGYNFNAAKSANCVMYIDGFQVIKGVFRLLEIIIDGKNIDYEFQIVGELGGLIAKLGNKRLQDLDFSAYNETFSVTNIKQSWEEFILKTYNCVFNAANKTITITFNSRLRYFKVGNTVTILATTSNNGTYTITSIAFGGNIFNRTTTLTVAETLVNETGLATILYNKPYGSGVYYPLIDYGNVSQNKKDFQYTAFRPGLFLREYIDKILTNAGYTWESNFFNSNFFKRLLIPNNGKGLFDTSATFYVEASTSTTYTTPSDNRAAYFMYFSFPSATLNNFTIDGNNQIFTYTNPAPTNTKLKINIKGFYRRTNQYTSAELRIDTTSGLQTYEFPQQNTTTNFDLDLEFDITFLNGNTFNIYFWWVPQGEFGGFTFNDVSFILEKDPPGVVELPIGSQVTINNTIPKGIFQKDLIATVLKMFNLMVNEDKLKEKHLKIEPDPDFYLTEVEDWSMKIDRSKPIRIKPMSELNARYYQFNFKQDNDFYNEQYRKKYNEGYGDRIFDSQYEFAKETDKLELIFSGTILYGTQGEDKVYPAIYKKSGNEGFEDTIEHNIRIMQVKKIEGVTNWKILNGATVLDTIDYYGYAGHLNDPDAPSSDVHFGAPKELFFSLATGDLSANLFNAYYSPYMAEITDKDSRLMTADFKLSATDIYNLDFSKPKWIDGGLWKLKKVIDWNTNGNELTRCELIKVINLVY
jgi:hypothetical protein